jgi:hypothetical protein
MPHHADITVLGGLPVTVAYTIQGPDPDVGIPSSWVEEFEITHIAGRKVKGNRANWLHAKLDKDRKAYDAAIDAIYQSWSDDSEYD